MSEIIAFLKAKIWVPVAIAATGLGLKYAWNYYRDRPRVSYRKMVAYITLTTFLVILVIEGLHWYTGQYPPFFFLLIMAFGSIWMPKFYIAAEKIIQINLDGANKYLNDFWDKGNDKKD